MQIRQNLSHKHFVWILSDFASSQVGFLAGDRA